MRVMKTYTLKAMDAVKEKTQNREKNGKYARERHDLKPHFLGFWDLEAIIWS